MIRGLYAKNPVDLIKLKGNPAYKGHWTNLKPIQIPAAELMDLTKFTIEQKLYVPANYVPPNYMYLFEHRSGYANEDIISIYFNTSGYLGAQLRNHAQTSSTKGMIVQLSEGIHVVGITADSSALKMYVDGAVYGSTVSNPHLPEYPGIITIGGSYATGSISSGYSYPYSIYETIISNKARTQADMLTRGSKLTIDNDVSIAIPPSANLSSSPRYYTKTRPIRRVYPVSTVDTSYQGWPSLAMLSDGTLICAYRTTENQLIHGLATTGKKVLRHSFDDGKSWGDEVLVSKVGTNLDNRNGGLLVFDDDGTETILHTFNTLAGSGDDLSDIYVNKSVDGGFEWSTPELVKTYRGTNCNPIQLSNGDIIFSAYSYPTVDHLYIEKSTDGGENWSEYQIETDPGDTLHINETALIETKSGGSYTGGVLAVSRTNTNTYNMYNSADYAESWGSAVACPALYTMQNRPHLLRIDSSHIMLCYKDIQASSLVFALSNNEGSSFPTNIYGNIRYNEYTSSFDYPSSILKGDKIITVFASPNDLNHSRLYCTHTPLAMLPLL